MSAATKPQTTNLKIAATGFQPLTVVRAIAKDWGWVMAAGVVSVLGGVLALLAPVLATGVVGMFIALTLLFVGCVNLLGTFFLEKGARLESFLTGVVQVLLAAVLAFYPFESLMSLTHLVAALLMIEGVVRIGLAVWARKLPGWGWALLGGVACVATSLVVIAAMPAAAFWVIGTLVGVSMVAIGIVRVSVALRMRKVAKSIG